MGGDGSRHPRLSQYLIAACDRGIAVYDRLTGGWMEYPLRSAATCVSVYRGRLIGVSECGGLILGNKRGGFGLCRFSGLFVIGLIPKGRDVYVCTDRGLFRFALLRDNITLLPVRLGFPVADADWVGDTIVVATLFRGIQSI